MSEKRRGNRKCLVAPLHIYTLNECVFIHCQQVYYSQKTTIFATSGKSKQV